MGQEKYEVWFAGIRGLGARKKYLLHEALKSCRNAYYIEETQLKKFPFLTEKDGQEIRQAQKRKDPEKICEEMKKKGIRIIPYYSEKYPPKLLQLADFPFALFVKGKLPGKDTEKAAIIGARNCTAYGEKYAVEYGRKLAQAGVDVISGLARGIDGMGHRGALMEKGKTFAVRGCGVDICYPREHIGLYMDILEQGGGILSEFPPGTPPLAVNFPLRNRIISGLSDVILIMEARERSGSLITADLALEQGKEVYALPGPVDSPLSTGCNRLIQQGAGVLLSAENLLNEWGIMPDNLCRKTEIKPDKNKKTLESEDELVYSCVGLYPKNVEHLVLETGLEIRKLMRVLVSLELQGYIKEVSKNYYIRR